MTILASIGTQNQSPSDPSHLSQTHSPMNFSYASQESQQKLLLCIFQSLRYTTIKIEYIFFIILFSTSNIDSNKIANYLLSNIHMFLSANIYNKKTKMTKYQNQVHCWLKKQGDALYYCWPRQENGYCPIICSNIY